MNGANHEVRLFFKKVLSWVLSGEVSDKFLVGGKIEIAQCTKGP